MRACLNNKILCFALQIQQLQDEKEDLQEEMEAAQKECAAERAIASVLRRQVGRGSYHNLLRCLPPTVESVTF